jgi:hypothetical protein
MSVLDWIKRDYQRARAAVGHEWLGRDGFGTWSQSVDLIPSRIDDRDGFEKAVSADVHAMLGIIHRVKARLTHRVGKWMAHNGWRNTSLMIGGRRCCVYIRAGRDDAALQHGGRPLGIKDAVQRQRTCFRSVANEAARTPEQKAAETGRRRAAGRANMAKRLAARKAAAVAKAAERLRKVR